MGRTVRETFEAERDGIRVRTTAVGYRYYRGGAYDIEVTAFYYDLTASGDNLLYDGTSAVGVLAQDDTLPKAAQWRIRLRSDWENVFLPDQTEHPNISTALSTSARVIATTRLTAMLRERASVIACPV